MLITYDVSTYRHAIESTLAESAHLFDLGQDIGPDDGSNALELREEILTFKAPLTADQYCEHRAAMARWDRKQDVTRGLDIRQRGLVVHTLGLGDAYDPGHPERTISIGREAYSKAAVADVFEAIRPTLADLRTAARSVDVPRDDAAFIEALLLQVPNSPRLRATRFGAQPAPAEMMIGDRSVRAHVASYAEGCRAKAQRAVASALEGVWRAAGERFAADKSRGKSYGLARSVAKVQAEVTAAEKVQADLDAWTAAQAKIAEEKAQALAYFESQAPYPVVGVETVQPPDAA